MNEEIFQTNLDLWSHTNPREAIRLQYFECSSLEIISAESGFLDLSRQTDAGTEMFYSSGNPVKEAENWLKTLDLVHSEVLYIYGVGLGYYYEALQEWLKQNLDRHVVFLEDDLEVIARFFETSHATALLSDMQVSLYYFGEIAETEIIFNKLFWDFPLAKLGFGALDYYAKIKAATFNDLRYQLTYDAAVKNSLVQEYLEYGIAFFRNFYVNILNINEAYLGNALFGQFDQIPAIICGAGPSLQKNISLLKTLENKAMIFGGSSSLNALAAEGIQPDIGAGIDPNPMQEERLKKITNLNFPFLYRNRIYPSALALVTGPKLYITGSGGYNVADFFESKFAIEGQWIEEGRNVVNFCLEAAYAMGCNPIIFVGMDLSFTGKKAYAGGVVEDPSVLNANEAIVLRKDIFGNDVETQWKWVSEAKWIGDFAESHPEITLINATEGGIGFPGVPDRKLSDVLKETLVQKHDFKDKLQSLIASHSLSGISKEKIREAATELQNGLKTCIELLRMLEEENDTLLTQLREGKEVNHSQTGKAALIETELVDEPAFIYVLQIFNEVASKLMQKDLMKLFNPNNPASETDKEIEKLTLNKQKYIYLSRVAQVNLELLTHALMQ